MSIVIVPSLHPMTSSSFQRHRDHFGILVRPQSSSVKVEVERRSGGKRLKEVKREEITSDSPSGSMTTATINGNSRVSGGKPTEPATINSNAAFTFAFSPSTTSVVSSGVNVGGNSSSSNDVSSSNNASGIVGAFQPSSRLFPVAIISSIALATLILCSIIYIVKRIAHLDRFAGDKNYYEEEYERELELEAKQDGIDTVHHSDDRDDDEEEVLGETIDRRNKVWKDVHLRFSMLSSIPSTRDSITPTIMTTASTPITTTFFPVTTPERMPTVVRSTSPSLSPYPAYSPSSRSSSPDSSIYRSGSLAPSSRSQYRASSSQDHLLLHHSVDDLHHHSRAVEHRSPSSIYRSPSPSQSIDNLSSLGHSIHRTLSPPPQHSHHSPTPSLYRSPSSAQSLLSMHHHPPLQPDHFNYPIPRSLSPAQSFRSTSSSHSASQHRSPSPSPSVDIAQYRAKSPSRQIRYISSSPSLHQDYNTSQSQAGLELTILRSMNNSSRGSNRSDVSTGSGVGIRPFILSPSTRSSTLLPSPSMFNPPSHHHRHPSQELEFRNDLRYGHADEEEEEEEEEVIHLPQYATTGLSRSRSAIVSPSASFASFPSSIHAHNQSNLQRNSTYPSHRSSLGYLKSRTRAEEDEEERSRRGIRTRESGGAIWRSMMEQPREEDHFGEAV